MMNEFIVWDNYNNRWLNKNECTINQDGKIVLLSHGAIYNVVDDSNRFTICKDTGKTDIEGNKIYADSSIIRAFHFVDEEKKTHYIYRKIVWSDKYSAYMAKTLDDKSETIWYIFEKNWQEIKIIGTLQQDKELLDG